MYTGISIAKLNDHVLNEDSVWASEVCIAVSDGAGGCGVYANEWSAYLIEHLDKDKPIASFCQLDEWIDGIWERFYSLHEEKAKKGDGNLLSKFYKEGSCATIAAAWRLDNAHCAWMAYGDSVVFHYCGRTGVLEHSFTKLRDFSNPPMLVSCKDPLDEQGFYSGEFCIDNTSVVFVASDALSHYILMMYELYHCMDYREELAEEYLKASENAQLLHVAEYYICTDFSAEILEPLLQAAESEQNFMTFMGELFAKGLVDMDDYSLAFMR